MRRPVLSTRNHLIGMDLSLRACAVCAVPVDWHDREHNLDEVRMMKTGFSLTKDATPKEHAERIAQIAHDICIFATNVKAVSFSFESYAYAAKSSSTMVLGELGGVVKHEILEMFDKGVVPIPSTTARKTLLQKVPRLGPGKTKPWVTNNIRRLKGPSLYWTHDECDAFCVVNHLLMLEGGIPLSYEGCDV